MPKFARRGSDVHLSCKYDTDLGSVYAVKWYKGLQEFYRYVPKEVPPVQVFPLPGIHVEVNSHISLLNHRVEIQLFTKILLLLCGANEQLNHVDMCETM